MNDLWYPKSNEQEKQYMTNNMHELLDFWFGPLGSADLPTSDRTQLWFGEQSAIREELLTHFNYLYQDAAAGKLSDWEASARGSLALIIMLDQFTRYLHHHSKEAFSQDEHALQICLSGIEKKLDHELTLIERVFFYMPLVHSENAAHQEHSIRLYQQLASLSMAETSQVYQLFLAYAYAHFRVIKEFGRFPQRNTVLGRESTSAELAFLKSA